MRRMKLLTVLCFSAMVLAAQPKTAQPKAAQPKAAPPAATPTGIPAGAVKAEDGYHYTDAQGRKWIYRQTPFGISAKPATDSRPAATDSWPLATGSQPIAGRHPAATDSAPAAGGHPATTDSQRLAGGYPAAADSDPLADGHPAATDSRPLADGRPAPAPEDYIRATDHGDTVSFERPGPFGVYRWERKKPDLDAGERAAWQRRTAAVDDRK